MSTVSPIFNVRGGAMPEQTSKLPTSDIDRDGFLKLLIAQIQNQDPLEPLSNEEFVQQLTSFSSLDELQKMNKGLEGLGNLKDISQLLQASLALQQANMNASAVSLIGKEVEALSDQVDLGSAGKVEVTFTLNDSIGDVKFRLESASGQMIYEQTINPSNPPQGVRIVGDKVYVQIPSTDANGNALPPGIAKIKVSQNTAGGTRNLETTLTGAVDGLDFKGERTLLSMGGNLIDIANVLAINALI